MRFLYASHAFFMTDAAAMLPLFSLPMPDFRCCVIYLLMPCCHAADHYFSLMPLFSDAADADYFVDDAIISMPMPSMPLIIFAD